MPQDDTRWKSVQHLTGQQILPIHAVQNQRNLSMAGQGVDGIQVVHLRVAEVEGTNRRQTQVFRRKMADPLAAVTPAIPAELLREFMKPIPSHKSKSKK